ncbi:MAG: acyltransferase, partial [Pseudomonadales bacterium]
MASAYGFAPKYLSSMSGWGANGVDLFFVLSGFVMLHSQLQKKRSPLTFLKFRLIRIVPIYWFVTLVVLLSFTLLPSAAFNKNTPSTDWVIQSLFFLSGAISEKMPVLMVGWTLEWEMLFYLVFGVSLLFSRWNKSYFFIFLVLGSIAIMTSNLIVFEFLAGMLIAYIYNNFNLQHKYGLLVGMFGFVLLLSSVNQVVDPR